jgi:hypothetical protein
MAYYTKTAVITPTINGNMTVPLIVPAGTRAIVAVGLTGSNNGGALGGGSYQGVALTQRVNSSQGSPSQTIHRIYTIFGDLLEGEQDIILNVASGYDPRVMVYCIVSGQPIGILASKTAASPGYGQPSSTTLGDGVSVPACTVNLLKGSGAWTGTVHANTDGTVMGIASYASCIESVPVSGERTVGYTYGFSYGGSTGLLLGPITSLGPGPIIDIASAPASQNFADATWTHAPGQQAKALLTFYARTGSKEPDGSQTYGGLDVPIVSDGYQASWDEADGYSDVRAKVGLDGRTGDAIVHAGSAGGNNVYALTLRHDEPLKVVASAVHAGSGDDQQWGATLDPAGRDAIAYIFTNNNAQGTVTPALVNGRSAVQKWVLDTTGKRISLYVHEVRASEGPQFIGATISSAVKAVTHVGLIGVAASRKRNQAIVVM